MSETLSDGSDRQGNPSSTVMHAALEAARTPAALGLASLVVAFATLLALSPAVDIGQLDTTSELGIRLPGSHTLQITTGVRFAVSLAALLLVSAAVRRLLESARGGAPNEQNWVWMVIGAAAIVGLIATALNAVAFFGALVNSPVVVGVYNHIGS